MADQFEFLSPEWIAAAKALRDESPPTTTSPAHAMRANLIVSDAPFEAGSVQAHVDTSSGELEIDEGHLEDPDLTITVDWATAKAIFVGQDVQAGLQAFMAGKVKIQGDMTKLLAQQAATPDPQAQAFAQKLKDLTA